MTKSANAEEAQWGHWNTHLLWSSCVSTRSNHGRNLQCLLCFFFRKLLVAVVNLTATPSPLRWTGFSVAADSNQWVQPPPLEAILGLMINLVCNFVENSDSSDLANASPMLCQQGIMWNAPKALGETPLWGLCNWIFIVNHTQAFLTTKKQQQQQVCWQAKLLYLL